MRFEDERGWRDSERHKYLVYLNFERYTALCAVVKPKEILESAASQQFQGFLWVLQQRKALYNVQSLNKLDTCVARYLVSHAHLQISNTQFLKDFYYLYKMDNSVCKQSTLVA